MNPISLLNVSVSPPEIFSKLKKKGETQVEDDAEVVVKKEQNIEGDKLETTSPQFIDELANVPVMSMDDFISKYVDDAEISESGLESLDEIEAINFEEKATGKKDKSRMLQRRWKVVLWDLTIENLTDDEVSIFIEIDFGTSREEFRVQLESHEYIFSNGELKHRLRTPILHKLLNNKPQKLKFNPSFEYRGSYNDIEKERIKLSAWRYHNFRLNTLDAVFDMKLSTCANSDMQNQCYLMRMNEEKKLEKVYKVEFNLYFQEIYDFQLSLDRFEIKNLLSYDVIMKKVASIKKVIERNPTNNSSLNLFSSKHEMVKSVHNEVQHGINLNNIYRNLLESKVYNHSTRTMDKVFESTCFNYSESKVEDTRIARLEQDIIEQSSNNSEKSINESKNIDSTSNEKKSTWDAFLRFFGISREDPQEIVQKLDSLLLEAQLDQAKIHPADCDPRLKIKIVWPTKTKVYTVYSGVQKGTNWPIWEDIGSIYLRGTIADLENCFLDIEVIDVKKERTFNSQARTYIPLKGLIENSTVVESKLSEPLWLAEKIIKTEERREIAKWEFGMITGNISFKNYPSQRQRGSFVHFAKDRLYLLIKITKVDNIITFENLGDSQVNVSITHQGLTAKSNINIGNGLKDKMIDDYIVFPLQLPPLPELFFFHLESLGEIYIDLWAASTNQNDSRTQHAGYTSFTIWDTIYTIKGTKRAISERYCTCYTSGSVEKLKVRVLEQEVPLKFIFPTDRVANIFFEAFITPDLLSIKPKSNQATCSKGIGIAERIDIFLRSRTELSPSQAPKVYQLEKTAAETTLISKLGTGIIGRFFLFSAYNQRENELMLSQFVNPMPAPNNICTQRAIFHFVRCIPFTNTSFRDPPKREKDKFNTGQSKSEALKKSKQEHSDTFTLMKKCYWFTPDFTLLNNCGGVIDHCLLHASLLLKQKIQAFVCIGTVAGGHFHSWVMSWHYNEVEKNSYIKFWEVTSGQTYFLRNRFNSQQRAREVILRFRRRERLLATKDEVEAASKSHLKTIKLPFKTIDTIFNEVNIWYNVQDNANPGSIFFDLWDEQFFISCTSSPLIHEPGFRCQPYSSMPSKIEMKSMKSMIKSILHYEIQSRRTAQNLGTRWNMDPTLDLFLEKGLEIIEHSELSSEEEYSEVMDKFSDWKLAIESKVPTMHRILGFPLSFNHTNSKIIMETIFSKLEILFTRDKSATFSISVIVNGYPNNSLCCRIFILVIQKVSEREKRKILEKHERDRIKEKELSTIEDSSVPKCDNLIINCDEEVKGIQSDEDNLINKSKEVQSPSKEIIKGLSDNNSIIPAGDYVGFIDKENRMIRKRRVCLPEGSVFGNLWISKKIKDDGNFRYYIDGIERTVSVGLNIPRNRVCATELNYEGQRVGFAILPGENDGDISPLDLMYEMALKVEELLKLDKEFVEFTGGDAVLEWDYNPSDDFEEPEEEVNDEEIEFSSAENEEFSNEENEEIQEPIGSEEYSNYEPIESEDNINEYTENNSISSYTSSGSNIVSSSQDEIQNYKKLVRESTEELSSEFSEESTNDKSKIVRFENQEDIDKRSLKGFKDSRNNKLIGKITEKKTKRFTKTGKYIIYRRPEHEKSKIEKNIERNHFEFNEESSSVYPAASLAISLARGHSEIKENGLLNMNRVGIHFTESKKCNDSKLDSKSFAYSNSNDLLSALFHNTDYNLFSPQSLNRKISVNREARSLGYMNKNIISRGNSISIRRN
ncbi:double C2-like domain-containing protein [Cryptosporidium felis]|nr:double C2-like domain-containing protein [Cryptosporidium felis]